MPFLSHFHLSLHLSARHFWDVTFANRMSSGVEAKTAPKQNLKKKNTRKRKRVTHVCRGLLAKKRKFCRMHEMNLGIWSTFYLCFCLGVATGDRHRGRRKTADVNQIDNEFSLLRKVKFAISSNETKDQDLPKCRKDNYCCDMVHIAPFSLYLVSMF